MTTVQPELGLTARPGPRQATPSSPRPHLPRSREVRQAQLGSASARANAARGPSAWPCAARQRRTRHVMRIFACSGTSRVEHSIAHRTRRVTGQNVNGTAVTNSVSQPCISQASTGEAALLVRQHSSTLFLKQCSKGPGLTARLRWVSRGAPTKAWHRWTSPGSGIIASGGHCMCRTKTYVQAQGQLRSHTGVGLQLHIRIMHACAG